MGMSKERRVFVGLFALAISGLAVDRVLLSPSEAAAAIDPAVQSPVGTVERLTGALAAQAGGATGERLQDIIAERIDESVAQQAAMLRFGPSPDWIAAPDEVPSAGGLIDLTSVPGSPGRVPTGNARAESHSLTMVMPMSTGGIAVIDGVRLRVGQTHPDGFALIAVGDRTATIERGGNRVVLSMPVPK